MWLKRISILNYKNLEQAELAFSRKMNCIIGKNGMGKTNLMDAVYYLSFCKSATNPIDSQNIRHEQDFFVLQGFYETEGGDPEEVYCGLKRRQKKQFKRNKKEYTRLSDHIGLIPLVMVSPADTLLIAGGSEERRRFMDVVISQFDREYLDALIRYNLLRMQQNGEVRPNLNIDFTVYIYSTLSYNIQRFINERGIEDPEEVRNIQHFAYYDLLRLGIKGQDAENENEKSAGD